MADFFDRVYAQHLALVVGEYGVSTGQDTQPAAQSLFNTAPSRGVGRIVWQWDGGDNNDLTVNTSQGGGWEIDNCQNPTNLSWLGQQVWNDNHAS
jgi:mannan endo-1,4-beta-mannosidase